jgi:hypothetical protein
LNRTKRALRVVESVEQEFGIAEAELHREGLVPETQQILNRSLKTHNQRLATKGTKVTKD